MYNTTLNTNTILHFWKRATIIPIPKPNKDHNIGTNYRLIQFLLTIAKTLLLYVTENISVIFHHHGLKHKHSTHTALHNVCHQITKGFNSPRLPQCTVAVALDMSKAFDTVNINKLTLTNIPNIIIKFIANYIKGRQACTQYDGTILKLKRINTRISQGGVLPPNLFNIYTFDILIPQKTYKSQHMLIT